ncbi:uncharacterized protein [Eucyclogobius newberryi]|uniref:uncharacterized protein n=1 Tax=Eucyclogobius newberryi TaxID=166745 RepID=UPI003B5B3FDC
MTTTWDTAVGAESYTLQVLGNTNSYNCTTANTSCVLDGVSCGEHFTVTLTASNENCSTPEVLGKVAGTAPCPPTNISTSNDCSPDKTTVSWIQSKGVVFYIVIAEDSSGKQYTGFSVDSEFDLESLKCGETYNVSVIGSNMLCNSSTSNGGTFQTASCPPTNVVAERDCTNNQASIKWDNHQPTGLYTAVMEDSQSGDTVNCTSSSPVNSCQITSPPCGKTFSVTVVYNYGSCSSTSTAVSMDSVPCQPQNVAANVSCTTGELTVTWTSPTPAPGYMTEISGGTPSQTVLCNSTETQCVQAGLDCGISYNLTVYSLNESCSSPPSSQVTVQTPPCAPASVSVQKACSPNHSSVTWATTAGANKYIAEAVSADGSTYTCESELTSCSFSDLQCGLVYAISVSGVNDPCVGPQSSNVTLRTEPCSPVGVTSQLDCQASTALVSWAASANAANYSVKATNNGSPVYCHGPTTSCTLHDLDCNQKQTITVTASDEICTSNNSVPFDQGPVPCAPQNVQTSQICSTQEVVVSWDEVSVSWDYNVTAVSSSGQATDASCTTSFSNCTLNGLACGQNYTITVIAFSGSCVGPTSGPVMLTTAPCGVANLTTELTCGSNTLNVSMSPASGDSTYTVTVSGPNGFSTNCTATSTTCQFTGLQCATQFNVSAVTEGSTCNSPATHSVVTTGPCDPANVTSALICSSDSATVSWDAAAGADAYTVKASEVGSQYETSCRNDTPSCQLNQLKCGKSYTLTVVSESASCNSTGTTASLTTAPCSPTIQYYNLTCGTNSSSLTWTSVQSATGYVVTAGTASGDSVSCTSVTSECTLTELKCSQSYTATVVALGNECNSEPGTDFTISTAPCRPSITSTQYTCSNSSASISWSDPGGSTGFYAEVIGNHNDNCNTTDTSCDFQNIPCGSNLHINVRAKGPQCNSEDSIGDSFETEPCQPSSINVTVDCEAKSATISWQPSDGAQSYVTELRSSDHSDICSSSSTTSCQPNHLHCGEKYNVSVTAVGQSCNTTGHMASNFYTEPCEATGVTVNYIVSNATVHWNAAQGATSYSVEAVSDQGAPSACTSSSTQCTMSGLQCSQLYNVTVSSHNQACDSQGVSSDTVPLTTEPCPPSNIQATVECQRLEANVSWSQSNFAVGYIAYLNSSQGTSAHCDAGRTDTSCVISGLVCDLHYSAWVIAKGETYNSSESTVISFVSAPCSPQSVQVQVNCNSDGGASLSWTAPVAANFSVTSVVDGNPQTLCTTQQNSCDVSGLSCGQTYNFNLTATNEQCSVTAPAQPSLNTRPCPLTGVSTSNDCVSGDVTVQWLSSTGADNYTATLTSDSGLSGNCTSQSTTCTVRGLDCGQNFTVSVTASNEECTITSTEQISQTTAPCVPTNIAAVMDCTIDSAAVSWTASSGAENYTVTGQSTANNVSCETSGLTCDLTNLSCGTQYTIHVVASDSTCSSAQSQPMTLDTGPCPPENVSAVIACETNSLTVSWTSSALAQHYLVSATAQNGGSNQTCNTTDTECILNSVSCGNTYVVHVTSVKGSCRSLPSQTATVMSKPCRPNAPVVADSCGDAQVSWTVSPGVDMYHVVAVGDDGHMHICNSSLNNCTLSPLHCDEQYSVSVTAKHEDCSSLASPNVTLYTGPCKPDNVLVKYDCNQSSALLTWDKESNAEDYYASAVDNNGSMLYCHSNSPSCTFEGLQCGRIYNFTVLASNGTCNSSYSDPVESVGAVPCPPENFAVQLLPVQDTYQILAMSWSASDCSNTEYLVRLTGNLMGSNLTQFDVSSYWTMDTYFELPLPCSSDYYATVETRNSAGTSGPSMVVSGTTAK